MLNAIKGILRSKKFWLTVSGSAVVGALKYFHISEEIIAIVAGLFGLNIAAQGMADFGKAKNNFPDHRLGCRRPSKIDFKLN